MNTELVNIKRALLSVYDKTGIVEFAQTLIKHGVEIISTGGTAKLLAEANIAYTSVAQITGFPEIMDGRVKTLHPLIHGAILGKRDQHAQAAQQHGITWIDLVVCNLYPFAQTISQPDCNIDKALANIDIGGPTMIRAASKNFPWVGVIVDPQDYDRITTELNEYQGITANLRKQLAAKAFAHTAQYDALIANYLADEPYPDTLTLTFTKRADLRYGENPHQKACVYQQPLASGSSILNAKQIQGKQLSFNNIFDAESALNCALEFTEPTCAVIKHANPCGVATNDTIDAAFDAALAADPKSAFGGIIALNRPCSETIAQVIIERFFEVVIAPGFSTQALTLLSQKKNLRVLDIGEITAPTQPLTGKIITHGLLLQSRDDHTITKDQLTCVTNTKPDDQQLAALLFAWQVAKHAKSNAIVIARQQQTAGIGAGQVSRVDAVDIALTKAEGKLANAVLASDAFFPFRDSIDKIAQSGIRAIIQPGGSIRDPEVIAACNEHGIAMVFTGIRSFNH